MQCVPLGENGMSTSSIISYGGTSVRSYADTFRAATDQKVRCIATSFHVSLKSVCKVEVRINQMKFSFRKNELWFEMKQVVGTVG